MQLSRSGMTPGVRPIQFVEIKPFFYDKFCLLDKTARVHRYRYDDCTA